MEAFQYPGSATIDASLDQLAERAIAPAARLLANAKQQQNDQELIHNSKIARMMEDPPGKVLSDFSHYRLLSTRKIKDLA